MQRFCSALDLAFRIHQIIIFLLMRIRDERILILTKSQRLRLMMKSMKMSTIMMTKAQGVLFPHLLFCLTFCLQQEQCLLFIVGWRKGFLYLFYVFWYFFLILWHGDILYFNGYCCDVITFRYLWFLIVTNPYVGDFFELVALVILFLGSSSFIFCIFPRIVPLN